MDKNFLQIKTSSRLIFCGLIIGCLLIIQGCVNTGKPKYDVENYLIAYPVFVPEKQTKLATTIRLNRFTISTAYNTQNMIFRQDTYTFDSFNYNRWAVNPADMVADLLLRDLQSSNFFHAVFSRYVVDDGLFLLQGNIEDFYLRIDKKGKTAIVSMEITLRDSREKDAIKRIVFQKQYRHEELLTDQTPRGYCQAMSKAVQTISQQILNDVYQAIKQASAQ
jgi:ABC-type uncharacterized transport system auxiliary subunit